jgi:hypothetical protein
MIEASLRGENSGLDPNILEKCAKELSQAKEEFQRAKEEWSKEEVKEKEGLKEKFQQLKDEWTKVKDDIKEILPLARVEREEKTKVPERIQESEKWDNSKLFTKSEIKKFSNLSPLYQRVSSRINSTLFKGQSDAIAGEAKSSKMGKYNLEIYHNTFETLVNLKNSLLGIKEQTAEEILITIAHEWAEIYWKEFMSEELKEKWFELSADSYAQGKGYISPLGENTNEKEDFCECIGYFEVKPEKLKEVDETKHDFIKGIYSSLKIFKEIK